MKYFFICAVQFQISKITISIIILDYSIYNNKIVRFFTICDLLYNLC